jgi:hypothetical protein
MSRKPKRPKPIPLTPAIIADMTPGEDRGDAQCPGLRVRCSASGKKRFFYRYRARDGVLREIKLGDVGSPLTLTKARDAVARKKLERAEGKDPQLEKRKAKADAMRERIAKEQAALRSRTWSTNTSKKCSTARSAAPRVRGSCARMCCRCSGTGRRWRSSGASSRTR